MSVKRLVDPVSRVLTAPLSRRQVLMLAGSGLVSLLWPRGAAGQSKHDAETPTPGTLALKMPIQNFSMQQSTAGSIIEHLRRDYGVPISFIAAAGDFFELLSPHLSFNVTMTNGTVQDVLNQMVSQHPVYQWQEILGRLVFLPNEPQYRVLLTGIHLHHLPRQEAADRYAAYLKAHVPGFEKLYFVSVGDPRARIFVNRVTLPTQGTVVELLVRLLGQEPMAIFNLDERNDGVLELWLNQVETGLIGRSD